MTKRNYFKSFHSHYRYRQATGKPRNPIEATSRRCRESFDDFLEEQRVRVMNSLTAMSIRIRAAKFAEDEGDSDPFYGIGATEFRHSRG